MKTRNSILIYPSFIIGILLSVLTSCDPLESITLPKPKIAFDIDGNLYHTVVIGTQTWMVENLKTTKYRNGEPISTASDWTDLKTEAYCDYNDDPSNSQVYGRLYNWYAVDDSRNIAPVGWHVPTQGESLTLKNYLGGNSVAGGKLKEAGTMHWLSPNTGASNSSGFTAMPGGTKANGSNLSIGIGQAGFYWSSTTSVPEYPDNASLCMSLFNNTGTVGGADPSKMSGFSVRCIKD